MDKVFKYIIDGMLVECNQEADERELLHYVKRSREKFPNAKWNKLIVNFDGEEVELGYDFDRRPFQRTRRITGYLSNLETWNNAKLDELKHRVKHSQFTNYDNKEVEHDKDKSNK